MVLTDASTKLQKLYENAGRLRTSKSGWSIQPSRNRAARSFFTPFTVIGMDLLKSRPKGLDGKKISSQSMQNSRLSGSKATPTPLTGSPPSLGRFVRQLESEHGTLRKFGACQNIHSRSSWAQRSPTSRCSTAVTATNTAARHRWGASSSTVAACRQRSLRIDLTSHMP